MRPAIKNRLDDRNMWQAPVVDPNRDVQRPDDTFRPAILCLSDVALIIAALAWIVPGVCAAMAHFGHRAHTGLWLTLTLITAPVLGALAVILALPHREHIHSRLALMFGIPIIVLAGFGWLMGPR